MERNAFMSPFAKKHYSLDYIWLLLEKLSSCGWNWENRALPHPRDKVETGGRSSS